MPASLFLATPARSIVAASISTVRVIPGRMSPSNSRRVSNVSS
jgi:hypothetical protein